MGNSEVMIVQAVLVAVVFAMKWRISRLCSAFHLSGSLRSMLAPSGLITNFDTGTLLSYPRSSSGSQSVLMILRIDIYNPGRASEFPENATVDTIQLRIGTGLSHKNEKSTSQITEGNKFCGVRKQTSTATSLVAKLFNTTKLTPNSFINTVSITPLSGTVVTKSPKSTNPVNSIDQSVLTFTHSLYFPQTPTASQSPELDPLESR